MEHGKGLIAEYPYLAKIKFDRERAALHISTEKSADVNKKDKDVKTPLNYAEEFLHKKLLKS